MWNESFHDYLFGYEFRNWATIDRSQFDQFIRENATFPLLDSYQSSSGHTETISDGLLSQSACSPSVLNPPAQNSWIKLLENVLFHVRLVSVQQNHLLATQFFCIHRSDDRLRTLPIRLRTVNIDAGVCSAAPQVALCDSDRGRVQRF